MPEQREDQRLDWQTFEDQLDHAEADRRAEQEAHLLAHPGAGHPVRIGPWLGMRMDPILAKLPDVERRIQELRDLHPECPESGNVIQAVESRWAAAKVAAHALFTLEPNATDRTASAALDGLLLMIRRLCLDPRPENVAYPKALESALERITSACNEATSALLQLVEFDFDPSPA